MVLALCSGCAGEQKAKVHKSIGQSEEISFEAIPADDPVYDQISACLPSIEKFVEYNHILGNTIDYKSVNAEDFWNIVAITVDAYEGIEDIASIDAAGVYHMKWNTMMEFAYAFMYDSIFINSTPNYRNSYAASADPGSGVIDLVPLGVDNYDASLEGLEIAPDGEDYALVMHIALAGRDNDSYTHHYSVYLADWKYYIKTQYGKDDSGEHTFPYMIVGYNLDYSVNEALLDDAGEAK